MNTKPNRILIVDDEQDLREILQFNLLSEGLLVDTAASAEEAMKMPLKEYQLILLDVMMGGMSGYQMAEVLRQKLALDVPIVFLTAKTSENDVLAGFQAGGDDYITKPFSIKEVMARIKAIMKRSAKLADTKDSKLKYSGILIDEEKKEVLIDGEKVRLTKKEFEILLLLLKNRNKYISREDILRRIWSADAVVGDRNVDVSIARMRKKIEPYGQQIVGRSGYGYCFSS